MPAKRNERPRLAQGKVVVNVWGAGLLDYDVTFDVWLHSGALNQLLQTVSFNSGQKMYSAMKCHVIPYESSDLI